MPITIQPAEQIRTSKYARWGISGQNGTGKTKFLSTIPSDLLTLVVSADDENTQPLMGRPHIAVAKIEVWEDVADILSMLQNPSGTPLFRTFLREIAATPEGKELAQKRLADPDVKAGKAPFWQVIGFDTWTRMQALAMNMIVGYKMIRPGDEAKYISKAPPALRGFDGWRQVGELAGEWMRYFQRQPIHTIFLMQEARRDSKFEDEPAMIAPALTPVALAHAKDTLSLIGRLYVVTQPADSPGQNGAASTEATAALELDLSATKENPLVIRENVKEVRKLLVGKHEQYFTKGDSATLGYVVTDPTWSKLAKTLAPS